MTDVFMDSRFVGTVSNPKEFVERVISERRVGKINNNLNISYDEALDKVELETAKGRASRPLIVVKEGKSLLTQKHIQQLEKNEITWTDLVKQGVIE